MPGGAGNREDRYVWQAGATGRLQIIRCRACSHWMHPPPPVCATCWSAEVAPEAVSGRGTVWSFTINRHRWVPGFERPNIVASIELVEQAGLRLTTNVIDCALDDVCCGMAVEVVFVHHSDVYVPFFRSASEVAR